MNASSLPDKEVREKLERIVDAVQTDVRAEFGQEFFCKDLETLAGLCHIAAYRTYVAIRQDFDDTIGPFIYGLRITAGNGVFDESTHLVVLAARRKGDHGNSFLVDPSLGQYAPTTNFVFDLTRDPYPLKIVKMYTVDPQKIRI